ncbi:helix-turn-helix transcriptional regulator [Pseudomonas sp. A-1]|uniref:helix-turn-helix transcriptional regulator n=1 Tax=Pseudomonas sp. A-1 TaxID=1821274 RepID=UPI0010A5F58C|nr:helix-turn-helix transcriptional regulator [Pseudomonas sp. A-1]THG83934.1 helix-turn-helix transcriptional regulator [Pseudomonas sp. A-1]
MRSPARQDPPIASHWLAEFGNALLDINRLARDKALESFHHQALQRLQRLLPFDKAWWGRAALIDGLPEEHSRHLFGLPAEYLDDWQSIREQDITVDRVHSSPGHAVIIDMQAADSPAGLRWLAARHELGELICIIHVDPLTQLSDHLALYRQPGAPRFGELERLLLDNLMPHLVAAVSVNQIRTLVAMRESLQSQALAMAVCDRHGVLYCAERGFVELLLTEWPQWTGPQLPEQASPQGYAGEHLAIESRIVGDLHLLTARRRGPMERLSGREREVALLFGEGRTYKEIARELGLAPNTVRHHIRTIYAKLGVNDKASVAHLLHRLAPD